MKRFAFLALLAVAGCNQPIDRGLVLVERAAQRIAEDQTFYHSLLQASGTLHDPTIRLAAGVEYYVIIRLEGLHGQIQASATGKEKAQPNE